MFGSHQEYLILAEQAERAAQRASGRIAKRFMAMVAIEYRKLAAEALKLEMSKGNPSA